MYHGEKLNTLTHLIGTALAIIGTAILINAAWAQASIIKLMAASIFGASLILLYGASTLYHWTHGELKSFFAKCDHCAIYILIAGTYTPFTLITLHDNWGGLLFSVVWLIALIGVARELWWNKFAPPAVWLYLLMGWIGIVAAIPLFQKLGVAGLSYLVAGCLLYSIGVIFYLPSSRWPHTHGIWHLFVMAGSIVHFFTVLYFVI